MISLMSSLDNEQGREKAVYYQIHNSPVKDNTSKSIEASVQPRIKEKKMGLITQVKPITDPTLKASSVSNGNRTSSTHTMCSAQKYILILIIGPLAFFDPPLD